MGLWWELDLLNTDCLETWQDLSPWPSASKTTPKCPESFGWGPGGVFEWKVTVGFRPVPPLAEARVTPASYRELSWQRMKMSQVCVKRCSHIQPFTLNLEHPWTLWLYATSLHRCLCVPNSRWQLSPMAMRTSMLSLCRSALVLLNADNIGQSYSIMLNPCCCFSDDIRRQRKHNILALKGLCFNISLPLSLSLSLLSVITRRDACRKWVGEWVHEGCTAFSDITGFSLFFQDTSDTSVH